MCVSALRIRTSRGKEIVPVAWWSVSEAEVVKMSTAKYLWNHLGYGMRKLTGASCGIARRQAQKQDDHLLNCSNNSICKS